MTKVNMQPIFEEFYAKAEVLATEAKSLDTDAQQRGKALTAAEQQDAQDRAALAEMERQVAALTAKVADQAQRLDAQRKELADVEEARDGKKAEAEAIVGIVDREKARIGAELAQQAPVRLPGAAPVDRPPAGSALDTHRDPVWPVEQDGARS